jgi:two-component system response regulator AtoC
MKRCNITILVVDDEPILREVCVFWLKRGGFERVLAAVDGADALVVLAEHRVDVLITDIHMPKMGGLELVTTMRERGLAPIILFMSAYTDIDLTEMHNLGVEQLLVKPFELETFLQVVTTSIEGAAESSR